MISARAQRYIKLDATSQRCTLITAHWRITGGATSGGKDQLELKRLIPLVFSAASYHRLINCPRLWPCCIAERKISADPLHSANHLSGHLPSSRVYTEPLVQIIVGLANILPYREICSRVKSSRFGPKKHLFTGTKLRGIKIRNNIIILRLLFSRGKKIGSNKTTFTDFAVFLPRKHISLYGIT